MAVGTDLYYISAAVGIVDTAAVLLRFAARAKSKARYGVDDFFIACSLIPLYAMIVSSVLLNTKGGLGRPMAELNSSQLSTFLKLLMATMCTYSLTIICVKISILLLYRRIFTTATFRKVSGVVGTACMLWFIIAFFLDIFQCRPFKAAFDPALLFTDRCIDLQSFYSGITIANLCLDIVVLYLPLHMVWKLKLPTKQKLILSGIFLLGGLSCIAGIMRVVAIGNLRQQDLSLSLVNEYAWSQIEPAVALLCACIATWRPLFLNININININHQFSKLSSSLSRSRRGRSKSHDWTDMENSRSGQMSWPVARDFPSENMRSQTREDEVPIFGRCEPVDLRPLDQPGGTYQMTEISDNQPQPKAPK